MKTKNKTSYVKGGQQMMPKQGISVSEAFDLFLNNSKFHVLDKVIDGVILILTLNTYRVQSPYISTNYQTYGKPITNIYLKVFFCHDFKQSTITLGNSGNLIFHVTTKDEFNNAVKIYKDAYFKTMDYLDPVCPALIHSNIYGKDVGSQLLSAFKQGLSSISPVKDSYGHVIMGDMNFHLQRGYINSIGIICTEYIEGTLSEDLNSRNYKLYKEMISYLILEIAIKTGYSQHNLRDKIMINTKSTNYFEGIQGRPFLVHFSLAVKIPDDTLDMMKNYCNMGQYVNALSSLCSMQKTEDLQLNPYLGSFKWACELTETHAGEHTLVNNMISNLFKKRSEAIAKIIPSFNSSHPNGPQLPLSDEMKMTIMKQSVTPVVSNMQKQNRFGRFIPSFSFSNKSSQQNNTCVETDVNELNTPEVIQKKISECCPKSRFGFRNNSPYCKSLYLKLNETQQRPRKMFGFFGGKRTRRRNRNNRKSRKARK